MSGYNPVGGMVPKCNRLHMLQCFFALISQDDKCGNVHGGTIVYGTAP